MPTERDSPSADWRRVYAKMGVDSDADAEEHGRLDDERIDAYAEEAGAVESDADESDANETSADDTAAHEAESGPSRRESHV